MGKAARKRERKYDAKTILSWILFASLVLSAIFTAVRLVMAPSASEAGEFDMQRSDYTLMLLQCLLGIVVMMLPSILERRWAIPIPNFIYVLYYIFLYCAVFLGEVFSFYYHVPHWDTILHVFSGAMLGALGFILVTLLNDNKRVRVELSPFFIALFAFCFAMAAGAVWEIYEYTVDTFMQLNMQKYMTEAGEILMGREALADTMEDIISDALAALAVSVVGYFSLKRERRQIAEGAGEEGEAGLPDGVSVANAEAFAREPEEREP